MARTTFTATCPRSGEVRTRSSERPYTHALTVVRTQVKQPVPGAKWFYFEKAHQIPKGYTIIEDCGSRSKGSSVLLEDTPAQDQKPETISLVSFHHSRDLTCKAAKTWERGGMYLIEAIPVPCTAA